MLAATLLAVLFMLALLPAMQGAFSLALKDAIEQRLASDVSTLISAARVEKNHLKMPQIKRKQLLKREQNKLPPRRPKRATPPGLSANCPN